MIRNPGCWKKACDEIDAARAAGRCLNRVITHEDAQQLPYLQASLKECLRIFSPIPSMSTSQKRLCLWFWLINLAHSGPATRRP